MGERLGKLVSRTATARAQVDQSDQRDHQQDRQSIQQGVTHSDKPYRSAEVQAQPTQRLGRGCRRQIGNPTGTGRLERHGRCVVRRIHPAVDGSATLVGRTLEGAAVAASASSWGRSVWWFHRLGCHAQRGSGHVNSRPVVPSGVVVGSRPGVLARGHWRGGRLGRRWWRRRRTRGRRDTAGCGLRAGRGHLSGRVVLVAACGQAPDEHRARHHDRRGHQGEDHHPGLLGIQASSATVLQCAWGPRADTG